MIEYFNEEEFIYPIDDISFNKKGQIRKRKPKEPRIYFTEDTEHAIVEYLSLSDQVIRNKLYKDRIQYAFYKLSENIIHTFKFYYTDSNTIEELKHEVVTFLLEKLHLFNHSKSINDKLTKIIIVEFEEEYKLKSFIEYTNNSVVVTQKQIDDFISTLDVSKECRERISELHPPKAYSYFGTIAKRYLINYNDKNYKKLQDHVDLDEITTDDNKIYSKYYTEENPEVNDFIEQYIKYIDKNLYKLFPKEQDYKAADAIMELFRKCETLELFNKKALYIYLREITDITTPQITKITKKLNILRIKLYNEYYENGYIL
jgi:hypothetical protein